MMRIKFTLFCLLSAISCLLISGQAYSRVYKLQPRPGDNQELVILQGQERLVQKGAIEVYVSCQPSTSESGVATIEFGSMNLSENKVILDPAAFRVLDHKGKTLKLYTKEEAHKVVENEKVKQEAAYSRLQERAQTEVSNKPTLDELAGSGRAQSNHELRRERESFGAPMGSPERRQKQENVDAEIRKALTFVRQAAINKNRMIEQYYLKKVTIHPKSAFNGILMFEVGKRRPKWVELVAKLDDKEFKMRYAVLK